MTIEPSRSESLKEVLRSILDTHLHQRKNRLSEEESQTFCEQLGLWPTPTAHAGRCRALEVFAARALPHFNAEERAVARKERAPASFERYRRALDDGDHEVARACVTRLRLWSRSDWLTLP